MAQNENISLSLANKVDILNKSQSVDARYGVYDTEEDALDAMALYGLDGRQVAVYSDKVNGKVKLYLYNQVEHKLEPVSNFEDLAPVALSNDYNDLDNKPTIPTVITNHSGLTLDDGTNPHNTTKSDVGLSNVPNLDTTDAVNNEHIQNTDTILDEGGANEITAATIKAHVEDTDNPHGTDLQKAYDETALNEDALEKVIGVNSGGSVVEQNTISQTLLNQYNQSSTTGDTQANLLQPDFGVAIFTSEDMQAGSSYKGEIYLEIDNNHTGTAKVIELFGIEIFNAKSAIPEINGRLTFDIDFYNQAGDDIDYRISFGFVSAGLQFYGSKEGATDNTLSVDIELTVDCDASDNIYVNKATLQRGIFNGVAGFNQQITLSQVDYVQQLNNELNF